MSRFARPLALLLLVACHGKPTADGGADSDTVMAVSSAGVHCPNLLKPKASLLCDGDAPVCCMKGQLMTPSCTADVATCGKQNSHLACDDATDCDAGQSCCLAQLNTGQQVLFGTCKAHCSLLEKPMCSGEGTCATGQTCCIDAGQTWGTCVKDGKACPVDSGAAP